MDNAAYVTLSRQSGLLRGMEIVANNLANMATTGFRREGAIFSEVVDRLEALGGSASQTGARVRHTDFAQGALRATGGALDFAIEGEGFFLIESDDGVLLTRAGAFTVNPDGELVTPDGKRVLGEGEAPVFIPPGARAVEVATDGAISADGAPVGRLALVTVEALSSLQRQEGGRFRSDEAPIGAETATLFQGFLESSNVDPIRELARMIEVQRAYEMGQSLLQTEDERVRQAVRTIGA